MDCYGLQLTECQLCVTGINSNVKAGPKGEEPPTREEEGEKMQANPSYLPIEMSYKSQEHQYVNVKMAPLDTEGHSKLQANPSYLPIEMNYKTQESKYINVWT